MIKRRSIASLHSGQQNGPICCLIDPEENGDRFKPFVFLDFLDGKVPRGFSFPMHPHSGIATLTWQLGCDVDYEDSTGNKFILKAGGIEWMLAGGGAYHCATLLGDTVSGFALWVALPKEIEDGPALGRYIPPDEVPIFNFPGGNVRVLLGSLGNSQGSIKSLLEPHQDMNYLVVSLDEAASWTYEPPAHHDVAFAFAFQGRPTIQGEFISGKLVEFGNEPGAIEVSAQGEPARILLGSAKKHDYPLVLGSSSVHTNKVSLDSAMDHIRATRPA